jgi:diguanylate cyclase (GGDEF)-like protein/PAS domain S-box-containing protein
MKKEEKTTLERTYRFFLDSIPQKIFYKDKNSIYIYCNKSYADDLKIDPEEIKGKTDYDFFPKELAEKYRADDRRIMEEDIVEEFEESYIKDGEEFTVHTLKAPVKDKNGKVIGILGVFWDITERKRMEEELRKSEERFRLISEKTSDMIVVTTFSLDPVYTYVSPSLKNIMGYEPDELIGKSALAGIHPEDREVILPILKSYVERRKVLEGSPEVFERLEYRVVDKNGNWKYIESTVNIMRDELLFISRDVTEKKEIENKLKELSMAIEHSPAAVVITEPEAKILYVNPRFEEITGYSLFEVLGKNPRVLQSGLTPLETYKELWSTILSGRTWKGEFINKRKNGEIYIESAYISPVMDSKGRIIRFVAVKIDITKQKKDELALKRSEERYKIISHLISDIAVSMFLKPDGTLDYEWIAGQVERITGYNPKELKEKECMKGIIVSDDLKIYEEHNKNIMNGKASTCEYRIITKDGKIRWIRDYGYMVKDNEGNSRIYKAFQEITERKLAEEVLYKEAIKDPLTGVFNRRFMNEFVSKEIKRSERHKRKIGFLLVDVDNFKEINDTYGHTVGDRVLKEVAGFLQSNVRQSDFVVRYGGDEFLIILTELEGDPEMVRDRIKKNFGKRTFKDFPFPISLSIGCSTWDPEQPRPQESILSEADQKMYEDKKRKKRIA